MSATFWRSDAGQELETLINQIVVKEAQSVRGQPTEAILKLVERGKINFSQRPQVMEKLLNKMINKPEDQKVLAADLAREEITNSGKLNRNWEKTLQNKTKENLKKLHKEKNSKAKQTSQNEFKELPAAAEYNGRTIKNPETGERLISQNGQWVPIDEGL